MNAKTLEAIKRHGRSILNAFPCSPNQDEVELCKKLRRIETATRRVMTDYCNGTATMEDADKAAELAIKRIKQVLGCVQVDVEERGIFVNRDPRGCALKIGDEWVRSWNDAMREAGRDQIMTDLGGYGLIAPDLTC